MKKIIFLFDIDGVITDYAKAFCKYHNQLLFKKLKPKNLQKIPFNEHLKYNKKIYDCIKYLFRISGGEGKYSILIKKSKKFINWAFENGYLIFIWTSRPITEFPNLKHETIWWLKKNKIKYHKLFFTDTMVAKEMFIYKLLKYKEIEKYKIIAVDDTLLSNYIYQIADEVYIYNQPYNQHLKGRRIKNLFDLVKRLKKRSNN